MKPFDHSSIRPRAATLFSAASAPLIASLPFAVAVLAAVLCSIFFPRLLRFAMPFVQAGIVVFIVAGLLSAARKKAAQQQQQLHQHLVPIKVRRRG